MHLAQLRAIAQERYDAEQIQRAMSAQARKRPELATVFVAPRSPMEERLAGLWSELLDIDQIGVNDNFFDLGGHSLLAMQLLSRIREAFQVELSVRSLFTDQFTVASLVKTVLERQIQRADQQNVATLLKKIGELSDDEIRALLAVETDRTRDQGRST
jgi:acyl carrier protein